MLLVLLPAKQVVRQQTFPVAQTQRCHQPLDLTLSSLLSVWCYTCFMIHHLRHVFQLQTNKNRIQLLSQAWKTNYSSPKGNGSRRIRGHRPPKNCVEIQQVWYIISRGPTAISILESICTLIVLTRTNGIWRLNSSTASLVWTRDQWSCWRAPSIKEIERNL